MIFWASAEVFQPAVESWQRCRRDVEPYLNAAFASSSLDDLKCELRYVPIIMPVEMRDRYPARSRLQTKDRVYNCSPQLDYEVFVSGSFAQQLETYVGGIAISAVDLERLGATEEQIADFQRIMATAVDRILSESPSQTRH